MLKRVCVKVKNLKVGDTFRTMNGEATYLMTNKRAGRTGNPVAISFWSKKHFGFRPDLDVFLLVKEETPTMSTKIVDQRNKSVTYLKDVPVGAHFTHGNNVCIRVSERYYYDYTRKLLVYLYTYDEFTAVTQLNDVEITIKG